MNGANIAPPPQRKGRRCPNQRSIQGDTEKQEIAGIWKPVFAPLQSDMDRKHPPFLKSGSLAPSWVSILGDPLIRDCSGKSPDRNHLDNQVAVFFSHCCWFLVNCMEKRKQQLAIQGVPKCRNLLTNGASQLEVPAGGCPRREWSPP